MTRTHISAMDVTSVIMLLLLVPFFFVGVSRQSHVQITQPVSKEPAVSTQFID